MNSLLLVTVLIGPLLAGVVDPTSARAIARQNDARLAAGEQALTSGNIDDALQALGAVDDDDRRLDRLRFFTLRGRARLAAGLATDAVADLDAARALHAARGRVDAAVNLALAGAERQLGHFDRCADVLAGLALDDDGALLAATCLRGSARPEDAHALLAGRTAPALVLLRARCRLEDGLVRLAREDAEDLAAALPRDELLGLARAFADAGDPFESSALAQVAAARFADADAAAAAGLWRRRALLAVSPHAARGAGLPTARVARELPLIDDDRARLRARVALLVDARGWEELRALQHRLRAARFLDDDDVRYAVAWALAATDDDAGADVVLDGMTSPAGFAQAASLRSLLLACRAAARDGAADDGGAACPR